jgi:RNA polymerase sigma factor (TIGR02999 family)
LLCFGEQANRNLLSWTAALRAERWCLGESAEYTASMTDASITELLDAWRSGDANARARVSALVYQRLHQIARQRCEQLHGTLQPTALLHEALLRLWEGAMVPNDRQHLYALASTHMRAILVDQARRRLADKRGAGTLIVTLGAAAGAMAEVNYLELEDALQRLEREDARTATMLVLSYFGGLDQAEIAANMALSLSTVERGLRFGRAWLKDALT